MGTGPRQENSGLFMEVGLEGGRQGRPERGSWQVCGGRGVLVVSYSAETEATAQGYTEGQSDLIWLFK